MRYRGYIGSLMSESCEYCATNLRLDRSQQYLCSYHNAVATRNCSDYRGRHVTAAHNEDKLEPA